MLASKLACDFLLRRPLVLPSILRQIDFTTGSFVRRQEQNLRILHCFSLFLLKWHVVFLKSLSICATTVYLMKNIRQLIACHLSWRPIRPTDLASALRYRCWGGQLCIQRRNLPSVLPNQIQLLHALILPAAACNLLVFGSGGCCGDGRVSI